MAKLKNDSVIDYIPGEEREAETNKYFLLVSDRYMRAKYFTLIILVLFLAFMLIRFQDDITYANLMYLLRDFNTSEAVYDSGFDSVEYDEQENMSFSVYRGELAVIGNRTLRMYNIRGEETRSYEPGYSDPALVASDKYLLAYNVGDTAYSVYTSIARVNDGHAPGAIEGAAVNDNGSHLLVCRSAETKYVVCTYDSAFRPIAKYYKNKYVTSASIGEKGEVVIASFDSNGGGYTCEIELYSEGAESPDNVYASAGIFPVKCGIWQNGCFYVICTDRVLFFNKKGELINSSESYSGYTAFSQSEKGLALSYDNDALGGNSTIIVFDTDGEMLYNNTIIGSASSLSLTEDAVYALAGDQTYMMQLKGGELVSTDVEDGGAVLVSSGVSPVLCRRNGARGLHFFDDVDETVSVVNTEQDTTAVSD